MIAEDCLMTMELLIFSELQIEQLCMLGIARAGRFVGRALVENGLCTPALPVAQKRMLRAKNVWQYCNHQYNQIKQKNPTKEVVIWQEDILAYGFRHCRTRIRAR